jgi:high-affinity nickel permease
MYLHILALILGFKHSYDADHLVAVSNLLVKSKSTRQSFSMSVSWAVGHMLTASIITILIYQFKGFFLTKLLPHFELAVGAMLVVLGAVSILSVRSNVLHVHSHSHAEGKHEHPHLHLSKDEHYHTHMFGIGIIHGLASNDELLILFTASLGITSLAGLLTYVGIFSLGVIGGMVLFGLVMSYPIIKISGASLNKLVTLVVGTISIVYGIWIIRPLFTT